MCWFDVGMNNNITGFSHALNCANSLMTFSRLIFTCLCSIYRTGKFVSLFLCIVDQRTLFITF